ncbi:hypothetical protein PybrP1_001699 [[Pythium] brassicae (nom. inval.)]|nr:hypothetical protein PybrP1_001699 [[Pythium] brassicae (nom. inval.)]
MANGEQTPLVGENGRPHGTWRAFFAKFALAVAVIAAAAWLLRSPYKYNVEMANNAYNISLLNATQVAQMKIDAEECIELTRECQQVPKNGSICADAQICWDEKLIQPFSYANRNNYDIRQPCNQTKEGGDCYDMTYVEEYLDSPKVRRYINVDIDRVTTWVESSPDVYKTFTTDGDWSMGFHEYVADMLDDNLRGKTGFNAAKERAFVTHDPLVANASAS